MGNSFSRFCRWKRKLRLTVTQDVMDTIKAEPGFLPLLAIADSEKVIEPISRIPFSEYRGGKTGRDGGVNPHSKIILSEVFS
ncbi:hypothetical protein TNCV_303081 [Trichonephila clavipes]|nr:hypothetical protein TNCV_303081 [Trichonephila clavipes]